MIDPGWAQAICTMFVVGVMLGLQAITTSRKLGQVCESVENLRSRCKERGTDHRHHYDVLEEHSLKLANHDIRIIQLEKVGE